MKKFNDYFEAQTLLGTALRLVLILFSLSIVLSLPLLSEPQLRNIGLWLPFALVPFLAAIAIYKTEAVKTSPAPLDPQSAPALVLIPGDFNYQERIAEPHVSFIKQAA